MKRARVDPIQSDDRRADRVGAHRGTQGEGSYRMAIAFRALQHQIAAAFVEPIEHLDGLERVEALQSLVLDRIDDQLA